MRRGEADIHITTLERFIRDSGNCFVLTFPEQHGTPGKISVTDLAFPGGLGLPGDMLKPFLNALDTLRRSTSYYLYSPA